MKANVVAFISGGIGDQLYHFSQLNFISKYHDSKIDIYCKHYEHMTKIGYNCDWINEIYDIGDICHPLKFKKFKKITDQISKRKYQYSYILHRSTSFKIAAWISNIKNRIGISGSLIDRFTLTKNLVYKKNLKNDNVWGRQPHISVVDNYINQFNFDFDNSPPISPAVQKIENMTNRLKIYNRPFFLINLFSKEEIRQWPVKHFFEFLKIINQKHPGTFFISSGIDAMLYHQELLNLAYSEKIKIIEPEKLQLTLDDEISLYHVANCYIGIDTFSANLAFNCDLPSLVMFAKKSDVLKYRSKILPIYPSEGKVIGEIGIDLLINKFDEFAKKFL